MRSENPFAMLNVDLVCISETWLKSHIPSNVVDVSGFRLVRRDRTSDQHGGVCIYIKNSIKYHVLDDVGLNGSEHDHRVSPGVCLAL